MPAGIIYVREELRQEAPEAVAQLRRAGLDRIIMLSGDSHAAAARAAAAAGIDEFHSSMLPEGKLHLLRELQKSGAKVAMVGDGVNDAPSLAAADLGVAMGAMGTAAAMEAADVALLGDDLGKVPYLLRLGRLAVRTININIVFAVAFNLLALIASGAGLLGPVTGALAHNAGSILVVANSARLLKKRI